MKLPSNRLFRLILIIAVVIVGWLVWESLSQPGLEQWEGKLEEVAFFRNENNTGPIRRIYSVFVIDAGEADMRAYAERMPYTKYGTTTVYFFSDRELTPISLQATEPHFDMAVSSTCLAVFEKNSMGQVSFRRNPFKQFP